MSRSKDEAQHSSHPKLRVISGLGHKRQVPMVSRNDVALALIGAGADLLLQRISTARAEEIERQVNEILRLFDLVDENQLLFPVLQRRLDRLETLVRESADVAASGRRRVPK